MKPKVGLFVAVALFIIQGCKKGLPDIEGKETRVSLSTVFSNNMVLQREKPINIFGRTPESGHSITVETSWDPKIYTGAIKEQNWLVTIDATGVKSAEQTITIKDNGVVLIRLTNILIGDVWLCSGQSNMLWAMKQTSNYNNELAESPSLPGLRFITVAEDFKASPVEKLGITSGWKYCNSQTIGDLSGVAYFFGKKIYTDLKSNIPIGLVVSSVGGTACEEWLSKESIEGDAQLKGYYGPRPNNSRCYNAMIYPLRSLAIKGVIWYQGEFNVDDSPANNYTAINYRMVTNWRNVFSDGSLPFYVTQIAPYNYLHGWEGPARLREAQAAVRAYGTAAAPIEIATTMDVGEYDNIHPGDKKPVGERLAALALKKTYNSSLYDGTSKYLGPKFRSFAQNGNVVTITLENADGLTTKNSAPINQDFYVAGADKGFYLTKATISNDKIILAVPYTVSIVSAIRYGWYALYNKLGLPPDTEINSTLQNQYGFPMEPFRTDSW
jgi:sialate O-acetylesterase